MFVYLFLLGFLIFNILMGLSDVFPSFFLGLTVLLIQLLLTVCNLLTSFVHFDFLFWIKQMNYKQYQQNEKVFYATIYIFCLLVTKLQHVSMIIGYAFIAIFYSLCIMNDTFITIFVHLSFFYKKSKYCLDHGSLKKVVYNSYNTI